MHFNTDKYGVMHLGSNNRNQVYTLGDKILRTTTVEKDVGVLVTENAKFGDHCKKVATKCYQIIGQVRRSFTCKEPKLMVQIFQTYILPHIRYCYSVWSPYLKKDIDLIKSIQRRFTKMIEGLHHLSYEERLKVLGLPMIKDSGRKWDLIQTYRILNGIDKVDKDMFAHVRDMHNKGTRHASKNNLVLNKSKLDLRKNFFCNRVIADWNSLPQEVQRAKTLKSFIAQLNRNIVQIVIVKFTHC